MTKTAKDEWQKRKQLEEVDGGFEPNVYDGLAVHSQNTAKHEFVKWAIAYALDEEGREWDSEVECDNGRVDIYDAGPVDGKPLVYEVETNVTPAQKKRKIEQYLLGPIRDVLVIDPADVPDDPEEAVQWVKDEVLIAIS